MKPCTDVEVAFYESAFASHPDFAVYIPKCWGTLKLGAPKSTDVAAALGVDSASISKESVTGTAATLALDDPGPMKGKKLSTNVSIVLENVAAGFKKPNILDLKLGARLYDETARPEKRARLDKIAAETTSSSLGFRIAGMRVWQGANATKVEKDDDEGMVEYEDETAYRSYNKMYGRKFSAEDVADGFKEFCLVPPAGISGQKTLRIVSDFVKDLEAIKTIFETQESRMYSASILLVYEGDVEALETAIASADAPSADAKVEKAATNGDDEADGEDDDSDEDDLPKLTAVKLIDFAHATWVPGRGPDENVLKGISGSLDVMKRVKADLEKSLGA